MTGNYGRAYWFLLGLWPLSLNTLKYLWLADRKCLWGVKNLLGHMSQKMAVEGYSICCKCYIWREHRQATWVSLFGCSFYVIGALKLIVFPIFSLSFWGKGFRLLTQVSEGLVADCSSMSSQTFPRESFPLSCFQKQIVASCWCVESLSSVIATTQDGTAAGSLVREVEKRVIILNPESDEAGQKSIIVSWPIPSWFHVMSERDPFFLPMTN